MQPLRGLTKEDVEKFYDHFGARQDKQNYYENVALADLLEHARFDTAQAVVEFGCGTGRFAEQLLEIHLPNASSYWGCDVSTTMIELSRKRLLGFGSRARLWKSAGEVSLPLPSESADCFVSNYVMDILSFEEIDAVIGEAKRILKKDGLLCLTGLTNGKGLFSKLWTAFWNVRFAINPKWVGGCRPIYVRELLNGDWEIEHYRVVVARGISSEVIVAGKRLSGKSFS
ncbi:MAG: class I SAM-dependent methyltransferase [Anaerolineales bacterium]|nr:class I SAM-dependent methyltransferase [Anaerolineales bacterium]